MAKKWIWKSRVEDGKTIMYKEFTEPTEKRSLAMVKPQPITFEPHHKESTLDCGIYVILCEKEKHAYVGQSVNMSVRIRSHKMCITTRNQTSPQTQRTYERMRAHCVKHGIEAFEFKKHFPIPNGTSKELIEKERETMFKFMEDGYTLYNSAGALEVKNFIHCPNHSIHLIIKDIIKALNSNAINEGFIRSALNV